MAVTLMNATNEKLEYSYAGVLYTFTSYPGQGSVKKVDDKAGQHLKHHLGDRGLVELDFNEDANYKEKKVEESRKINKHFKTRQVQKFNQLNQQRQDKKISYAEPSPQLQEYADEIGISLIQPFIIADDQTEKIARLKQEKELLEKSYETKFAALEEQNKKILALLDGKMEDSEEANERALMRRYSNMSKNKYYGWLTDSEGSEFYMSAPVKVQENMRQKFDNFYDLDEDKIFPY